MKILLIEDDNDVSNFIKNNLTQDNFTVDIRKNGSDGSYMARTNPYDLIIMDHSLPDKDGTTVTEEIRTQGIQTPILFLTIHHELSRRLRAFEKGADDYLMKPFAIEELKARIYALHRRSPTLHNPILTVDDLILDTTKKSVCRGGIQIYLTRKTYDLLEYLMRNKGVVLSRGIIMECVWNSDSDPFSNTIEAHILNLRKKINVGGKKNLLKNIPGRGYIISSD